MGSKLKVGDYAVIIEGVASSENVGKVVRVLGVCPKYSTEDTINWVVQSDEDIISLTGVACRTASLAEYRLVKVNLKPLFDAVQLVYRSQIRNALDSASRQLT